jgi:hypothetical protein
MTWYQQSLIESIEGMSRSVESSMIRNILLEYRRFTRHPVWTTLRYLNVGLIQPIARGIKTVLFGWKKEKSDTDRIVESVNQLTEFMMTGQIDKTESFMDKYIRKGLVQSMGARLVGALGYSQEGAQRHEDLIAQGKGAMIASIKDAYQKGGREALDDAQYQIYQDSWSAKFFKSIVKRGRMVQQPNAINPDGAIDNQFSPFQSRSIELKERNVSLLEYIAKTQTLLLAKTADGFDFSHQFMKDLEMSFVHATRQNAQDVRHATYEAAAI